MTGKGEMPPDQTKGKGELTATYDTANKKLSYKGMFRPERARDGRPVPWSRDARQERRRADSDFGRGHCQEPVRGLGHAHRCAGRTLLSGQW